MMRAYQPGSRPIDTPEVIPNPAVVPKEAPVPKEPAPKEPVKVLDAHSNAANIAPSSITIVTPPQNPTLIRRLVSGSISRLSLRVRMGWT